jgi:hypothetical protein
MKLHISVIIGLVLVITNLSLAEEPALRHKALGENRANDDAIRHLEERLDAAEAELRYFRQRDTRLQAWEAVVERLPATETLVQPISAELHREYDSHGIFDDPQVRLAASTTGDVCNCCGVWRNCHCPCQGGGLRFDYHGYYLIVRGKAVADMLFADSPTTPSAFTLFAQPRPTPDREVHEISGRRTSLMFTMGVPQWGSFDVEANIGFDFQGANPGAGTPGLYFALGNVHLTNDDWRFVFGRDFHLTGPVMPVSLNWAVLNQAGAIGSPGQKEQFRVDRFIHWSDQCKITFQIAATNPNSSFIVDPEQTVDFGR